MEKNLAEFVVHWAECGGEDASIYEDYSGRGMYGDTTTAITCPNPQMLWVTAFGAFVDAAKCGELDDEYLDSLNEIEFPHEMRVDNMGHDFVVY